ncbi:hypothetical protein HYFRA_00011072 [Hymenoscyphus fraxineus]|uniref:MFS general substrate transporter n=1 Tax=Hymenoscyphus fraxineus TaxID=746836 RepID=A0A9N9L616_9HELO|nr:hypothetical protein HYFRA_00011072 [Hymenoscyphus fraxineus]
MVYTLEAQHELAPQKRIWHRTTFFNACVIGGVGFIAPGLWNAMNSLGAGGAQAPYLVNAANALVFGLMGIFCLLGGPIANRIGLSYTLLLGAQGNVWLVLVGAVTCGVSAGLFWASEGAVALGYPESSKRGKYLNIWLVFRTGGPIVGGAIVLALNHGANQKGKGKVGYQIYLIFIALQCVATPLALALSPPEKVQRTDGTKVKVVMEKSFAAEIRALGKALCRRDILLLLPIFWAAYFNQYLGNFQTYYFGVRARALIGFVGNFSNLLASFLMSSLLDYKKLRVQKRISIGFYYAVALHLVAWIYGWVIQEKYTRTNPSWDWEEPGFVEGFFVIVLWSKYLLVQYDLGNELIVAAEFSEQSIQSWMYYFISTKTDNISELCKRYAIFSVVDRTNTSAARFTGILRGQESFAQAVSFGLNSRNWKGGRVPLAVNTILLGLAVVPTWIALREHVPVESDKAYGFEATSDEQAKSAEVVFGKETARATAP